MISSRRRVYDLSRAEYESYDVRTETSDVTHPWFGLVLSARRECDVFVSVVVLLVFEVSVLFLWIRKGMQL